MLVYGVVLVITAFAYLLFGFRGGAPPGYFAGEAAGAIFKTPSSIKLYLAPQPLKVVLASSERKKFLQKIKCKCRFGKEFSLKSNYRDAPKDKAIR